MFLGRAAFTGPNTLIVNGRTLTFARAVIASGGRPRVPAIAGIGAVPYLTNTTVFNLTELPPRLAIVGGGPVGLELAQAFRRFGAEVTVLLRGNMLLPKEDPDAAAVVAEALRRDGVRLVFGAVVARAAKRSEADPGALSTLGPADRIIVTNASPPRPSAKPEGARSRRSSSRFAARASVAGSRRPRGWRAAWRRRRAKAWQRRARTRSLRACWW